jgi:hypothetical protein
MLAAISIKYVILSIKLLSYLLKNLYEVESKKIKNFARDLVISGATRYEVTYEVR